jgi:hypothetical protein
MESDQQCRHQLNQLRLGERERKDGKQFSKTLFLRITDEYNRMNEDIMKNHVCKLGIDLD